MVYNNFRNLTIQINFFIWIWIAGDAPLFTFDFFPRWQQLQVMFNNRKDRAELLQGLIISNKDTTVPKFTQANIAHLSLTSILFQTANDSSSISLQKIHLLWGENDEIFKVELAWKLQEYVWFSFEIESQVCFNSKLSYTYIWFNQNYWFDDVFVENWETMQHLEAYRRRVTWFTWNDLVSTIGVSRTSLLPCIQMHKPNELPNWLLGILFFHFFLTNFTFVCLIKQ